jgi:hypothetical protein
MRAAWRAAVALTCLTTLGALSGLAVWTVIAANLVERWPWWMVLCVSISAGVTLWIERRHRSIVLLSRLLSMATIGSVFIAAWHTNDTLARAHRYYEPFEAFKLAALTVALVGPTHSLLGFTCVFASGAIVALRYATWPESVRSALPLAEPFVTFLYVAISAGVYAYRMKTLRLERRAIQAEAEASARLRAARTLAAAGDLFNTPLQTIELTVPLLRAQRGPPLIVMRIERSVERLRHVSRLVERYAELAHWQREDTSIDALAVLEEAAERSQLPVEPTN